MLIGSLTNRHGILETTAWQQVGMSSSSIINFGTVEDLCYTPLVSSVLTGCPVSQIKALTPYGVTLIENVLDIPGINRAYCVNRNILGIEVVYPGLQNRSRIILMTKTLIKNPNDSVQNGIDVLERDVMHIHIEGIMQEYKRWYELSSNRCFNFCPEDNTNFYLDESACYISRNSKFPRIVNQLLSIDKVGCIGLSVRKIRIMFQNNTPHWIHNQIIQSHIVKVLVDNLRS